MNGPQISWLRDGRRLHMNHGPIDLIVEATGDAGEMQAAYAQAAARFRSILDELVAELPLLRTPFTEGGVELNGPVARRMQRAVWPYAPAFITPMAAVAGAVAEEVMAALLSGRKLARAYVNNGGDIALHLAPGASINVAIAGTVHGLADRVRLDASSNIRGVATSGWRGRSFSLGIADAVTVLAHTAAQADAAATIIANAVDLPLHPAIQRRPACELAPDSDLGARLVTVEVARLAAGDVAQALEQGRDVADDLRRNGLIVAAALYLQGQSRFIGDESVPKAGAVGDIAGFTADASHFHSSQIMRAAS